MTTEPPSILALACQGVAPLRAGLAVAAGVTFALGAGAALVLRGANGSGKTSVLRAVAGLCRHEGDVAFTDGAGPVEAGAARAGATHLLGGGDGLSGRLTPMEHVRFWSGLYGVPDGGVSGEGVSGVGALARVGLAGAAGQPAAALSTGQRRRLGLARLLMAPRPLRLLDEPLSGLDEAGRALLLRAVADHRAAGGLVLMATHEDGLPDATVLRLG